MKAKVAQLLKKYAALKQGSYRAFKRAYNDMPRPDRDVFKRGAQAEINTAIRDMKTKTI